MQMEVGGEEGVLYADADRLRGESADRMRIVSWSNPSRTQRRLWELLVKMRQWMSEMLQKREVNLFMTPTETKQGPRLRAAMPTGAHPAGLRLLQIDRWFSARLTLAECERVMLLMAPDAPPSCWVRVRSGK
jgi:hypothetical protein